MDAPTPHRGRSARARAAASLLIAVVSPGCATIVLWGDNRTHEYEVVSESHAFRAADDGRAIVVALDDAAVARLRELAPSCAAAAWLDVRLADEAEAAAILRRREPELWMVHEEGAAPAWWFGERERLQKLVPPKPPSRTACVVTPLAAAPTSLGGEIDGFRVVDVVVRDDGTPIVVRVTATPLAVALDGLVVGVSVVGVAAAIVLSPIGLVLKGLESAFSCGDH